MAKKTAKTTSKQDPRFPGRLRIELLDVSRGLAILLMLAYHFCYDLNYFNFISVNFNQEIFWLRFRELIVGLFILIAGSSLTLANNGKGISTAFIKRLGILAACAGLVSLGSYFMFADFMIRFGILHFIAVASVLGLAFIPLGLWNLPLGAGLFWIGLTFHLEVFNSPWLHWIGLVTQLPQTVDYVPVLPWFGLYLAGVACGHLLLGLRSDSILKTWTPGSAVAFLLALAGRHSLLVYLLHQPVLLGIIGSIYYLTGTTA